MFREHSATTKATSAMDILKRTLETPNEEDLLREVRIKAKEILRQMASPDLQAPDLDVERLPAEWVAKVYQALFEGAAPESQETYDIEAVQKRMGAGGLPEPLIQRLAFGR